MHCARLLEVKTLFSRPKEESEVNIRSDMCRGKGRWICSCVNVSRIGTWPSMYCQRHNTACLKNLSFSTLPICLYAHFVSRFFSLFIHWCTSSRKWSYFIWFLRSVIVKIRKIILHIETSWNYINEQKGVVKYIVSHTFY